MPQLSLIISAMFRPCAVGWIKLVARAYCLIATLAHMLMTRTLHRSSCCLPTLAKVLVASPCSEHWPLMVVMVPGAVRLIRHFLGEINFGYAARSGYLRAAGILLRISISHSTARRFRLFRRYLLAVVVRAGSLRTMQLVLLHF